MLLLILFLWLFIYMCTYVHQMSYITENSNGIQPYFFSARSGAFLSQLALLINEYKNLSTQDYSDEDVILLVVLLLHNLYLLSVHCYIFVMDTHIKKSSWSYWIWFLSPIIFNITPSALFFMNVHLVLSVFSICCVLLAWIPQLFLTWENRKCSSSEILLSPEGPISIIYHWYQLISITFFYMVLMIISTHSDLFIWPLTIIPIGHLLEGIGLIMLLSRKNSQKGILDLRGPMYENL